VNIIAMKNKEERLVEFKHEDYARLAQRVNAKIEVGYKPVKGLSFDGGLVQMVQPTKDPVEIEYKIVPESCGLQGNTAEYRQEAEAVVIKKLNTLVDLTITNDKFERLGEPTKTAFEPRGADHPHGCVFAYQALIRNTG
jgi:hypothetical protein